MGIRESFFKSVYEDSLHLSDQLLLPNIVRGNNAFLVGGNIPSYIVKLLSDLHVSEEIEPGHVTFTLCLSSEVLSYQTVARQLHRVIEEAAGGNVQLARHFVESALHLMDEIRSDGTKSLNMRVLATKARTLPLRGCAGVLAGPGDRDDYVTFEDARPGDFNSPVRPKSSWQIEQILEAEKVFHKVTKITIGDFRSAMHFQDEQVRAWLSAILELLHTNSVSAGPIEDQSEELSQAFPELTLIEEPVLEIEDDEDLDEYQDVGWDDEDFEAYSDYLLEDFGLKGNQSSTVSGHVPPLDDFTASIIGPVTSVCKCGRKFLRAEGCPAVIWDRWNTDYQDDI